MLFQLVAEPHRLSEAAGAALAMHREGGRRLLELVTDAGQDYLSRRVALQSLGHHFVYHPRHVPELAGALLEAGQGSDILPPAFRQTLEVCRQCPPEHAEDFVKMALEAQGPGPQIPIEGAWILEGDERNELAHRRQPISALFPPRELAAQVKAAWKRLMDVPLPLFVPAKGEPVVRAAPRVGRNAPCPCGSGSKYKQCCLGRAEQAPAAE
jgi:hypothetical protein